MKTTAIILAAGQGKRMKRDTPKQYLDICGKPVLYYAAWAFEESSIDDIVLVTGREELAEIQTGFVKKYKFQKIKAVVEGGKERYDSVYCGLLEAQGADYVLIHDGARPCITPAIIEKAKAGAVRYGACVIGMPSKDTIKLVDESRFAGQTPDRSGIWITQTPQAFSYEKIRKAYDLLFQKVVPASITDDAMVLERMLREKVYMEEGSYENIKITTPEDLKVAEIFLKKRLKTA